MEDERWERTRRKDNLVQKKALEGNLSLKFSFAFFSATWHRKKPFNGGRGSLKPSPMVIFNSLPACPVEIWMHDKHPHKNIASPRTLLS